MNFDSSSVNMHLPTVDLLPQSQLIDQYEHLKQIYANDPVLSHLDDDIDNEEPDTLQMARRAHALSILFPEQYHPNVDNNNLYDDDNENSIDEDDDFDSDSELDLDFHRNLKCTASTSASHHSIEEDIEPFKVQWEDHNELVMANNASPDIKASSRFSGLCNLSPSSSILDSLNYRNLFVNEGDPLRHAIRKSILCRLSNHEDPKELDIASRCTYVFLSSDPKVEGWSVDLPLGYFGESLQSNACHLIQKSICPKEWQPHIKMAIRIPYVSMNEWSVCESISTIRPLVESMLVKSS